MYKEFDVVTFPLYQGVSVNMMPVVFGERDSLPLNLKGYFNLMQDCRFKKGEVVYLTVNESIVNEGETQRRGGLHTEGYVLSAATQAKLAAAGVETFGCHGAGSQGSHGGGYVPTPTPVNIPSGTPYKPSKVIPRGPTKHKPAAPSAPAIPQIDSEWDLAGLYMASTDGACEIYDTQTFAVDEHGGLLEKPIVPAIQLAANKLYWCTDRTPHEALPAKQTAPRQFFRLVSSQLSVWYTRHNTANPLGVQPTAPIVHFSKFER